MFTVAFPRQLKHHVLMHALFGHELGHATFYTSRTTSEIETDRSSPSYRVIDVLRREGPLRNCAAAMQWLSGAEAPEAVRNRTARIRGSISEANLEHWHVELLCDLFGLVIFGPSFSAAHRTYLEPSCKSKHELEIEKTSHPAYVLRRTLLAQALKVLEWDQPVTTDECQLREAEQAFLDYIGKDHYGPWAQVFSDDQLREALSLIRDRFDATDAPTARRPDPETLSALVERIRRHLPPIREEIDEVGVPKAFEVRLEEQLYAGWTYWLGSDRLSDADPLPFFKLNQLCDLALLQQQAIELVAGRRHL